MGEVRLATDNDLRRQVAVKLLRDDAGGGLDQLLHFVAEAQATSQLEHPGIPPVHDSASAILRSPSSRATSSSLVAPSVLNSDAPCRSARPSSMARISSSSPGR